MPEGILIPLVARIRKEVRTAVGCWKHTSARTLAFLEDQGLKLYSGLDDLVLFEVYQDRTTSGTLLTRGDIVIPGSTTIGKLPVPFRYGCHFRKTFTASSPPLRRGETPHVEFDRTNEAILAAGCGRFNYIQPLLWEPLVYRARAIPGVTFASLSNFRNLTYEQAISVGSQLDDPECDRIVERLLSADEHIRALHEKGFVHGDLHPDNLMVVSDQDGNSWTQMIDFASAASTEGLAPEAVEKMRLDDRIEFLREIALLQISRSEALPYPMAQEALRMADDLFPEEIARLARDIGGPSR